MEARGSRRTPSTLARWIGRAPRILRVAARRPSVGFDGAAVIFGLILPVTWLWGRSALAAFDPGGGDGWSAVELPAVGIQMAVLVAWFVSRRRAPRCNAFFSGAAAGGVVTGLAVAARLGRWSLGGGFPLYLPGALIALTTAAVFTVAAGGGVFEAERRLGTRPALAWAFAGLLLLVGVPGTVTTAAGVVLRRGPRALARLDDPVARAHWIERLRRAGSYPFAGYGDLFDAWNRAQRDGDEEATDRLAEAFEELTGSPPADVLD